MASSRWAFSQSSNNLSFKSSVAAQADFWFDASLLYVRVTNCQLTGDCTLPEVLNVHFPPREIATCMEVNGGRIPPSEEVSLVLRRNRIESETADAFMYVSTDNLRMSSTLHFQILDQDTLLVSGILEKLAYSPRPAAATPAVPTRNDLGWIMATTCEIGSLGCAFVKAKYELFKHGLCINFPNTNTAMEICVVGRFKSEPVILTQTLMLTVKRRSASFCTLNAIPEDNEDDKESCQMYATAMVSNDFLDEVSFSIPSYLHLISFIVLCFHSWIRITNLIHSL